MFSTSSVSLQAQVVAYGLNSVESFGMVGASALNFGLWGASLVPAWLVIRKIGTEYVGRGVSEAEEAERLHGGQGAASIQSLEDERKQSY